LSDIELIRLNIDNAGHDAILEELLSLSEAFQSEDVTFDKSKSV
jgi:hypothetical protein